MSSRTKFDKNLTLSGICGTVTQETVRATRSRPISWNRRLLWAKETIKEATTKATEAVKETVEKTTVKASEVIEEAKDAAADIAKAPVVEEAKETVKKAVKEVAKNIDIKKFAETTIELPGFAVTMSSIEEAIKKDIKDKGIEGKEISVYVNVEQKAAYYTVDGQGSDDYRIDLNTL